MMKLRKRKSLYWLFKVASVIISCAFPIWAIYERFPLWEAVHGTTYSAGVGSILILFVVLFVFRRTVFNFLRDKLNLRHAPPLLGWLIMIAVAYTMMFISKFIQDITAVCWMGLAGCVIGTILTFIAENCFAVKKENNNG